MYQLDNLFILFIFLTVDTLDFIVLQKLISENENQECSNFSVNFAIAIRDQEYLDWIDKWTSWISNRVDLGRSDMIAKEHINLGWPVLSQQIAAVKLFQTAVKFFLKPHLLWNDGGRISSDLRTYLFILWLQIPKKINQECQHNMLVEMLNLVNITKRQWFGLRLFIQSSWSEFHECVWLERLSDIT